MTMFAEPPTLTSPRPADGETDLATLLELFTVSVDAEPSRVESLRDSGAWLRGLVRRWSRRAADWGVAPRHRRGVDDPSGVGRGGGGAVMLLWPMVAVGGFFALAALVVALATSSTSRYEFERNRVQGQRKETEVGPCRPQSPRPSRRWSPAPSSSARPRPCGQHAPGRCAGRRAGDALGVVAGGAAGRPAR
ncbi:hypothetical protein A7K94_0206690 [Modestobacter sp. VKM Ac-2676]|nr:hypothetical protein A7K94_0206690 [Modestobacter sp. VKM Ac-2676]